MRELCMVFSSWLWLRLRVVRWWTSGFILPVGIRVFKSPYLEKSLKGRILIAYRGFDGPEVMTAGRGKGVDSQKQYAGSVLTVVGNPLRLPWRKVLQAGPIFMPGPLPSKG